jgi:hypothetical protein
VAAKDSKAFWSELLPEAAAEHAAQANRGPEVRHAHSCGQQHMPPCELCPGRRHMAPLSCMSGLSCRLSARMPNRLAVPAQSCVHYTWLWLTRLCRAGGAGTGPAAPQAG